MSKAPGWMSQYAEGPNLAIFCAALQGYLAAQAHPSSHDLSDAPRAAVEFARKCVRAAYNDKPDSVLPDLTGSLETTR